MNLEKNKIDDLMNEWMLFRDETLCKLTKHLFDYNKFSENLLRNVSPNSKHYVQK